MNEYLQLASFALIIIVNIVGIVWNWAKLDKRIAVMEQKTDDKLKELSKDIKEIKENDLIHIKLEIKELSEKFTEHLISHN